MNRLCLAGLLLVAACGDDTSEDAGVTDVGGGDMGVQSMAVSLKFAAKVGAEDARCGVEYASIGVMGTPTTLNDLRFYVSNVRLVSSSGAEVGVALDQNEWQHMNVALLDFEDGTAGCNMFGNAATNDSVTGMVPQDTYETIRFDVGVPFELNHLDVSTAPSPLNINGMQWNWQAGYKHIRIDTVNATTAWNLHIGSTGCMSGANTEPPEQPCARPNVMKVELTGFSPGTSVIALDLAQALADSDVSYNTPMTPPGCMSFPTNQENCAEVFPRLGLDFTTGQCMNGCAGQSLFSVQ